MSTSTHWTEYALKLKVKIVTALDRLGVEAARLNHQRAQRLGDLLVPG